MDHHVPRGHRAVVGIGMMTVGAVIGIVGLTAPASAHESQVEPEPTGDGKSCAELGELFGVDQEWHQSTAEDIADDSFSADLTLDDRGTEATDDDAVATIHVNQGKTFDWEANIGIDAVYVQGRDAERNPNSYFYLYAAHPDDEEPTSDVDLGTPPYRDFYKNKIKSITFCWDEDETPESTTTSSTTSSTTTSSTTTSTPTSSSTSSSTTSSSVAPSSSTSTPPTTSPEGGLPQTGSNTGLLVGIGAALLVAGAIIVATTRQLWRRHEA